MSLPVRTTADADTQIREIDDWWRTNRRSSPDLFLQELTASFDIIGEAPFIGRLYRQSPVPGTRRVLLKGTRYHLCTSRPRGSEVLAVWHARRGAGPPLRAL